MACPNCGSWAVKADRSLAGRMVCARCGQPLGLRGVPGGRLRGGGRWPSFPRPHRHWRNWLGVVLVVGVAALLASQQPRQRPQGPPQAPAPRSGEPLTRWPGVSVVAIR
jgi:hypothetical protein